MTAVEIRDAFLANYAEARDSLVTAVSAFPEWWTSPSLPFVAVAYLVVNVELEESEILTEFLLDVSVERPNADIDYLMGIRLQRGESTTKVTGAPLYKQLAARLRVEFKETGKHEIVVACAATEQVVRVPLAIQIKPSTTSPNIN